MSLPKTGARTLEEIQAGVAKRRLYQTLEDEVNARHHGPGYLLEGSLYTDHENDSFNWSATHAAKLVASNPRVTVKGYGDPLSMHEANALEQGANRDIRRANLRRQMQDTFPDWAMFWFVTVTTTDVQAGCEHHKDPAYGPLTKDIDRDDFFADANARRWSDVRIAGHKIRCDRKDLILRAKARPEEGWDIDAIRGLPRVGYTGRDRDSRMGTQNIGIERDEVEYWSVWYEDNDPKMKLEEGEKKAQEHGDRLYNGQIMTVAETGRSSGKWSDGLEIRKRRGHFGAPSDETIRGPYVMHGCYAVSRHIYPLSPVLSTWHQQRLVNEHIDRMIGHSKASRDFWAIDGLSTKNADKLRKGKDGEVFVVPGLNKDAALNFKFGGVTPEDVNVDALFRALKNRNSGMSDTDRGMPAGGITATADALANDSSNARLEYCAQRLADGWRAVIKQRIWLMRNDVRCAFRLQSGGLFLGGYDVEKAIKYAVARRLIGHDEAQQLLQPDVLEALSAQKTPWFELDIDIDVYSMQRTSEALQQRRLTEGADRFLAAAPLMPQTPYIEWDRWLNAYGDALNWPDYGMMLNKEKLNAFVQAQMAAAAAEAQPQKGAFRSPNGAQPLRAQAPEAGASGGGNVPKKGNSTGSKLAGATRGGKKAA